MFIFVFCNAHDERFKEEQFGWVNIGKYNVLYVGIVFLFIKIVYFWLT